MFSAIRKLLFETGAIDAVDTPANELRDVAMALLIQAALIDGNFTDEERDVILAIIERDYGASSDEAVALVEEAEARVRKSAHMFRLTTAINKSMDADEKLALMEKLWTVVLADNVINKFEDNLMRRLAGLLHVPDRENGLARQRVQARLAGQ